MASKKETFITLSGKPSLFTGDWIIGRRGNQKRNAWPLVRDKMDAFCLLYIVTVLFTLVYSSYGYGADANKDESMDALSQGLYTNRNCSTSAFWQDVMLQFESAPVQAYPQIATHILNQHGWGGLLSNEDPCLMGAYAIFLHNIWSIYQAGSLMGALINFASLNDDFLEALTPVMHERYNAWPMKDVFVREIRSTFLYNIRKHRIHYLLYTNKTVTDADIGGLFRSEMRRQIFQRLSRQTTDVPYWEPTPYMAYTGNPHPTHDYTQTKIRIYVYDDGLAEQIGQLTTGSSFCHRRQWGSDVGFYDFFRQAPEMTKDPELADYFFVPGFAFCLHFAGLYSLEQLDEIYKKLIPQLPYFKRNGGRDHIFTFHYQDVFPSWRQYIPNSIFIMAETEIGYEASVDELGYDPTVDKVFKTEKDIVVPPYMAPTHILNLALRSMNTHVRPYLVFFAGKLWPDVKEAYAVRKAVKDHFEGKEGAQIFAAVSMTELLAARDMYPLMGQSKFCLVPRGRAAWSVRFFETFWSGCVPVILSDHLETPFENLFDVTKYAIKWPVARISELYDYLREIPSWKIAKMAAEGQRIRCWFLYTEPEVSWVGRPKVVHEQHQLEDNLCPNLGSSRNVYQGVLELLARRARKSRTINRFYYPALPESSKLGDMTKSRFALTPPDIGPQLVAYEKMQTIDWKGDFDAINWTSETRGIMGYGNAESMMHDRIGR